MEYNLKDYFKGKKLEEQLSKYVKSHPNASTEEINTLKEYFQNLSEEEKNEMLYEVTNNRAKRSWAIYSVFVLISG